MRLQEFSVPLLAFPVLPYYILDHSGFQRSCKIYVPLLDRASNERDLAASLALLTSAVNSSQPTKGGQFDPQQNPRKLIVHTIYQLNLELPLAQRFGLIYLPRTHGASVAQDGRRRNSRTHRSNFKPRGRSSTQGRVGPQGRKYIPGRTCQR
jgi:hypothetical protein